MPDARPPAALSSAIDLFWFCKISGSNVWVSLKDILQYHKIFREKKTGRWQRRARQGGARPGWVRASREIPEILDPNPGTRWSSKGNRTPRPAGEPQTPPPHSFTLRLIPGSRTADPGSLEPKNSLRIRKLRPTCRPLHRKLSTLNSEPFVSNPDPGSWIPDPYTYSRTPSGRVRPEPYTRKLQTETRICLNPTPEIPTHQRAGGVQLHSEP